MLLALKMAMLELGVRQTRMAIDLGMDPSKVSRIVNEIIVPTADERRAIAAYLRIEESKIFSGGSRLALKH